MLHFRDGLRDMPSYDLTERDWKIKVNANESSFNLPPLVEERVMARLSGVAFHRSTVIPMKKRRFYDDRSRKATA